jgi:hypothetical protein
MPRAALVILMLAAVAGAACSTSGDKGDASSCQSVDEVCAADGGWNYLCVRDWSTAQRPSTWCGGYPNASVVLYPNCGGFNVAVAGPISDTSTWYFYDVTSGALVGIEFTGNGGASCIAQDTASSLPVAHCFDGSVPVSLCAQSSTDAATE